MIRALATCLIGSLCLATTARAQAPEEPSPDPAAGEGRTALPAPAAPPPLTPPRLSKSVDIAVPADTPLPPSGAVEMVLTVGEDGSVTEVTLETEVEPALADAVRQAASALVFEPARQGSTPVASRIRFRFRLAAPAPPPDAAPEVPPAPGADAAAGDSRPATAPDDVEPGERRLTVDPELDFGATARIDKPDPGASTQVTLRGEELTAIPGTFGEPLRVVSTLPGVARSPFGLGFFLVRGASFQNTGFLVDGFPVPLLYHLGAGPAILSSRLVDKLDFYPGGYPLAYGRFNAGIIALTTAPPPTNRGLFEFEVDLLRASVLGVLPFAEGKGSVAVALRRSYYDLILPLVTDDVSLFYADYQLRLDYRVTPRLRVAFFFFGSRDGLDIAQDTGAGETTGTTSTGLRYDFDRVIASVSWQAAEPLTLRWSGTAGPSSVEFGQSGAGSTNAAADTSSLRLGQRLEATYGPSDFSETTLGIEENVFINEVEGRAPSVGELPGIPSPVLDRDTVVIEDRISELSAAPYLEQILRPGRFEITGGLRMEYLRYGDVETWVAEPRGVMRYEASDPVTLKAATGLFSQPPLPFQLIRGIANPDLAPNRSWQSSVGAELKLPVRLEVDTTLFYSRMWQLTRGTSLPSVDEDGTVARDFFADDGEGRAFGWELLLRRRAQKGLFGWLSYTLSRSERFLEGGATRVFAFDQTHVLNLAASYKVGRWRFGARFMLATGRPINDFLASEDGSDVLVDTDADRYVPDNRGRRTRLPTFNQLDVRIDREWTWGPVEGSVFLDVINVYNAQNAEGYLYEYDFSRRARLPGLPLLPTIGVKGKIE